MKILYDYQAFDLQRFGGVSRYFVELFTHFENIQMVQWELPIIYTDNEYLWGLPAYKSKLVYKKNYYKEFLFGLDFKGKWTLYNLRNKLLPRKNLDVYNKNLSIDSLNNSNYDIFHPTYYDDYFLPYVHNKPYVLTIYDMIHEKYPQYYPNSFVRNHKRKLANQARKIIAISENTKKDIMDIYKIEEYKIEVIYLGNSIAVSETNIPEYTVSPNKLPQRYLLYVGGRGIYKNFYPFLKSIIPLLAKDKDLYIVCTGEKFNKEELSLLERYKILDQVIHFETNDKLLSILYNKAMAFVFPSLYEGFGLPILEAFQCGCPVISSNKSSLPEVGGDAVVYFDPNNLASIYDTVVEVVNNEKLRNQLTNKGYEQLKKFSWENTGKKTLEVYKNII
jgi:glycosyltransferase involved in cell wall biosynthesis